MVKRVLTMYDNGRGVYIKPTEELTFVERVYRIVKDDTEGMDAIYGDYIKQLVGVYGLNALIENRLVENCGVMNGRILYVLCDKKGV